MRSSAIAEELIARGQKVVFVGSFSDVPWLTYRMNVLGFSEIFMDPEVFRSDPSTDVLILDSYSVPMDEEFIQQKYWKSVVTIIDKVTPEYQSDLKIHPGLSTDWMRNSSVRVLAGPKYIPFRKSIEKNLTLEAKNSFPEILIIGGGTDSSNFVEAVSKILKNIEDDFRVHMFTDSKSLTNLDSRFNTIPFGSELDELAATAEIVFTTASTTSLEFVAREVAVGIGCSVDNQEEYYESLSAAGIALPVGKLIEGRWDMDELKIIELVRSKVYRDALRQKCANLIDLNGASRIVDELLEL
jgi:spore coat polysaccharide biosynthesis predicted glycosyltransferase SpsG